MRVLYFHQHFSTPRGAAGTRSYEFARKLVTDGHEVLMVCGSYAQGDTGLYGPFAHGRRKGTVDGIEVLEFDLSYSNADGFLRRSSVFLRFALSSVRIALAERYDVLFATTTPLTAGIPGVVARWFRGKPFVFEVRDLWPELPRAMGVIRNPAVLAALSAVEWVCYRSATRSVALSPGILDGIAARGVQRGSIAVIPNGCDIDLFSSADAPGWRPEGIGEGDFMAVFTGTHGRANGLDAILDAAAELKARSRQGIKLVLVGDGALKPSLVERARREGLDNVVFHPPVPKVRLVGLMREADIGIQCLSNVPAFYRGTSPNKFFDYIASGLPVLINYPGWLAELIDEAGCGYVVPPEDPAAFADALKHAAANRTALRQMARNARRLAEERFDRRTLAAEWQGWVLGAAGR